MPLITWQLGLQLWFMNLTKKNLSHIEIEDQKIIKISYILLVTRLFTLRKFKFEKYVKATTQKNYMYLKNIRYWGVGLNSKQYNTMMKLKGR